MFLVETKPRDLRTTIKAYDKQGRPIDIVVLVSRVRDNRVTIGVEAPKEILIDVTRDERDGS